jgi:hypothetical protein
MRLMTAVTFVSMLLLLRVQNAGVTVRQGLPCCLGAALYMCWCWLCD